MNSKEYVYQFVAGNLALDFVNTVAYRFHPEKMRDHLQSAQEFGRWANQAHLPGYRTIKARGGLSRPAFLRVRAMRDLLFAIFHAVASRKPVPGDALFRVGQALHHCSARQRLSARGTEVRWTWHPATNPADILLCQILTSAVGLLSSNSRSYVRRCADEQCGWLFLDRSNARKRRWCNMADCGNRNKVRAHYRRRAGS
jgi:predicted RNA-binding Zn ribbon-like protein